MHLSDKQKEALKDILRRLDMKQSDFAVRAKYSNSSLSEILNPAGKKGISEERWRGLKTTLREIIHKKDEELRRGGLLDHVRAQLAEIETGGPQVVSGPLIQTPGGIIRSDAVNYIMRACDSVLLGSLHFPSAPAVIVSGGIQFGKSSLVHRLGLAAREQEYDFLFADANTFYQILSQHERPSVSNLFEFVFHAWGVSETEGKHIPAEENPVEWAIKRFQDWATRRWQKSVRAFLVVDSLDTVLRLLGHQAIHRLLEFFTWIRNLSTFPPFDNLTLVTVFSGRGWSAAYASPFQYQAHELKVPPFKPDQIERLLRQLEVAGETAEFADHLYQYFRGHPHLTHLAAFDLRTHGDLHNYVFDSASNLKGGYGAHWHLLRREILAQVRDHGDDPSLLWGEILKATTEDYSSSLYRKYRMTLEVLGLLERGDERPEISDFYRSALEKELVEDQNDNLESREAVQR